MASGERTWEYRVVKHIIEKVTVFAIHDIQMENGGVVGWNPAPVSLIGESTHDIAGDIERIVSALSKPELVMAGDSKDQLPSVMVEV